MNKSNVELRRFVPFKGVGSEVAAVGEGSWQRCPVAYIKSPSVNNDVHFYNGVR